MSLADIFTTKARAFANKKGGSPEDARRSDDMTTVLETRSGGNGVYSRSYVSDSDFNKKLRWKITSGESLAERWTITPSMASVMLQWNDRNRPVSTTTTRRYTHLMKEGRWHYTGEPIIFSSSRLIDGQHRLAACVESGVPIDALVVFGAPDGSFAFIDVGKTRSASDIFAINGVKNAAVMAAATLWISAYEKGMIASVARGRQAVDHQSLYDEYLKHPRLQDSAWVASLFFRMKSVSPSMLCGIHYICAQKNRTLADEFFRKVAEGIGFEGKKDPAYKLHKYFIDAAVSQQIPARTVAAAITIKAWNATRLGRDVGVLRFGVDETFPKVK